MYYSEENTLRFTNLLLNEDYNTKWTIRPILVCHACLLGICYYLERTHFKNEDSIHLRKTGGYVRILNKEHEQIY